ncbi:MAG: AarF/UbiB family protein [Bacteroidales bacterium]|nr:AarF/UbiB family protein [Bacteroidales bacterium]
MSLLRRFTRIPRSYRHINRYREIIFILIKYGLGNFIGQTRNIGYWFISAKKKKALNISAAFQKKSIYERIRLAMEELGPTFVKFGQLLSNRPDILPFSLIEELEKLQKNVAPLPFKQVEKIINEEFNENKENYFLIIEPVAIASGSIAQVHAATLKSGEKVVLKVQRPGISKQIETDIEIMQYLAKVVMRKFPEFKAIDTQSIINEFKHSILREIDFNQEVANMLRFQNNFKNDKNIYIPKIYEEFCCKNILVMERIEGYSINDLFTAKNVHIDPKSIAEKGANFVLTQIFTYGFFHADPHPGNIIILEDSRICFLDFGMTGTLPYKYRLFLSDFILGFVIRDTSLIIKVLKKFVRSDDAVDLDELELKVSELVDEYTYMPLNKIDSAEVLNKVLGLLVQFKLDLPPVVYMLLKTMVTIEGVARKLDPDFNITEYVEPFAKKLLIKKLDPFEFVKRNYTKIIDSANNLIEFPGIAFEVTEMLRNGKLKINIASKDLEQKLKTSRKNNYQITLSILAAAIFLSSSLLIMAKIPPFWNELSVLGIVGYAFAILIAIILIWKGRK